MQQITINVYSFDELDGEAKQAALEAERQKGISYEWWAGVFAEFDKRLDTIGIKNAKMNFSLAYSQGDYAKIYGGDIDEEAVIKIFLPKLKHNLLNFIVDCSAMYFDKDGEVTIEFDYWEGHPRLIAYIDKMVSMLQCILNKKIKALNQQLYMALREEYEALVGDDAIIERFRNNETLFYADGKNLKKGIDKYSEVW